MVFSFDSPQEYSADFVMATLATTTTTGDITSDHHHTARPTAAASTTKPRFSTNQQATASISKQKLSANHNDIVATPSAAVSIAETPKDGNPISWLQERSVVNNGTSDHHNGEPISGSRPVEDKEFVTHSHDGDTDNLLDSLFDDIINDDIADNVYGFTHQHPHTNTGNNLQIILTIMI